MILSDRSIREAMAVGRIVVDPLGRDAIQPSSVDVRVDTQFRVFANHRHPFIDVRVEQPDLTELVEVEGDEPFILHPGEFVLGSTLEKVSLPDDLVARIEGKALAVETPVPTPSGWKTMGSVTTGDLVFDETGAPTRVVAATEVLENRRCLEVVFSDGQTVIADAQHRWVTTTKAQRSHARRERGSVTTRQIKDSLRAGSEINHHVALAGPARYTPKLLPIDPYVLGVWLGDGNSTAADITCADPFVLEELRRRGYEVRDGGGVGLRSILRDTGVLGNKHVPTDYLISSVEQRTDLLQGLMDSDGHVDASGRCEFSNANERLADAVVEVAAGLGLRPVKSKRTARLDGIDCGPVYVVKFTPDRPVFRLPRKLARQKTAGRFNRFRGIVDVRPVPSQPVRCIQVAAASGQFLVGRTFIPTHNSSLGRLGLLVHATAGFVDAGFSGWLTLELSNVSNLPIAIYPAMKIGQVAFFQLTTPADEPYGSRAAGSKYQGQRGPTASRYFQNFDRP